MVPKSEAKDCMVT